MKQKCTTEKRQLHEQHTVPAPQLDAAPHRGRAAPGGVRADSRQRNAPAVPADCLPHPGTHPLRSGRGR